MKRLAYLATILLAACTGGERAETGQCPAGETCSAATPNGLQFLGVDLAGIWTFETPEPTAVGGTQDIALEYQPAGSRDFVPLDLPYTADDDGGAGIAVDHQSGPTVTIRGVRSLSNYLRILDASDGSLLDRKELTGSALDAITLVPVDPMVALQVPANMQPAWAPGDRTIGVALWGQVQTSSGPVEERIVDQSMQLALTGADRAAWDQLHLAAAVAGTYPITVTAGDHPATTIDLIVADHADSIAQVDVPASIPPGGSAEACFAAVVQGHAIVGLPWTYVVDGVTMTTHGDPCFMVQTSKTSCSVSVEVSAGGQTTTATLAVATARTQPARPLVPQREMGTTAGERAAAM